nr:diaminopimelate epimerase [Klebsiella variicola]
MTPLHFHKYHGLGNDYLVCHRDVAEQLSNEHIQMLCHRHYGVGSDGLLIDSGDQINPTLRIINPDGSEAEKSGNGLRIYARYLFDIGRVGHEP